MTSCNKNSPQVYDEIAVTEQSGIAVTDSFRDGTASDAVYDGGKVSCAPHPTVESPRADDGNSVNQVKKPELVLVVTSVADDLCHSAGNDYEPPHPSPSTSDVPPEPRSPPVLKGRWCCSTVSQACCDIEHSKKIKYTAFVFLVNVALGGLFALPSTAFLDLLQQTQSNIQQGSVMFIIGAIAYTLGSIVCGHLYDKLNVDVIFGISAILAGFFVVFMPLSSSLVVVISLLSLSKLFQGSLDSGSTLLCAKIWGNAANPYQQAVTFFYALGGIITPLAVEPFLLVPRESNKETNNSGGTGMEDSAIIVNNTSDSPVGNSSGSFVVQVNTNLYIPFVIFGIFSVLTSVPFIHKSFRGNAGCMPRDFSMASADSGPRASGASGKLVVLTLILISAFFVAYGYIWALSGYSMPFAVDYLGWSKKEGTQLSSVTWSALAVGCFLGIFVARCLRPSYMMFITLTPITIGLLALLVAARHSEVIVWTAYIFIFAGAGSLHPATISWVDQRLVQVNGKICSLFVVTINIGDVTNSLLLGYLFQNESPMWYVYLTFGSSVFQWFVLLGLYSTKFCKSGRLVIKDTRSIEVD